MTYAVTVLQQLAFVYALGGTTTAFYVLWQVSQRPGTLDTLAYLLPEDSPKLTYRALLCVVLVLTWALWPLVVASANDREGPWKG